MRILYPISILFGFMLLLTACNASIDSIKKESIESPTPTVTKLQEQHRPTFHFTPPEKWMNDPNGMVYYEGEYHLFYQHYPEATVWGPMHWGHAVSEDLVNWEHLPIALYPDSLGYIFSGSAVIDWKNTSGFGINGVPPMIAIYTYHNMEGEKSGSNTYQYQAIAYSNDKGRTWTKYEGNPVVPNPGIKDFRDPKVIWDESSNQWVMVFAAWDHVKLYGSKDLKKWEHLSDFGKEWGTHAGVWECPDLFPMRVSGTGQKKWVLLQSINPGGFNGGSGTQYFIGNFDGKDFTVDKDFAQAFGTVAAVVPKGTIYNDFEGDSFGEWQVEGTAFGTKPTNTALPNQGAVSGQEGAAWTSSFHEGDAAMGKLTSPSFTIEKPFINFLIGGGNDKLRTCINLVHDGKVVRNAAGANSEKMDWKGWDVKEFVGKKAHLEIVDKHPSGWGHINLDQIIFADSLAKATYEKAVWLDYGRDNYAGVTWSNAPNGRTLFMGWMSNWDYAQTVPTSSWRSAMTIARALSLQPTSNGLRLFSKPVKELQNLRQLEMSIPAQKGADFTIDLSPEASTSTIEVNLTFKIPADATTKLSIIASNGKGESYTVGYTASNKEYFSDRRSAGKTDFSSVFAASIHPAPRTSVNDTIQLRVLLDVASAELFADYGETVLTDIFFPTEDFTQFKLVVENGPIEILEGKRYSL